MPGCSHVVRPPEDSPGSLSPIGNDKALRMEGFFASCSLADILEGSPRGENRMVPKHRPA